MREELGKRRRGSGSGKGYRLRKRPRPSGSRPEGSRRNDDGDRPLPQQGDNAGTPTTILGLLAPTEGLSAAGVLAEAAEALPLQVAVSSDGDEGAEVPGVEAIGPSSPEDDTPEAAVAGMVETSFPNGGGEADSAARVRAGSPAGDAAELGVRAEPAGLVIGLSAAPSAQELPAGVTGTAKEAGICEEPTEADRGPEEERDSEEEGSLSGGDSRARGPLVPPELPEALQTKVLIAEAARTTASHTSGSSAVPSGVDLHLRDSEVSAKFSALVRSAFCGGEASLAEEGDATDLVEIAFRHTGVPNEAFLLSEIDDIALGRIASDYASRQNAMIMRALKWRLHMAIGAWAQDRRKIDRLKGHVDSTSKLSQALVRSQKALDESGKLLSAATERASGLAARVSELEGFREQLDQARSELSQVKADHDDKTRAMQTFYEKRWDQLKASHAGDKDAWGKKLEEAESDRHRQREQLAALSKRLDEVEDRLKRSNGLVAQLSDELDYANQEVGVKRSRIDELKESLRQSQSAESRALCRAQDLGNELAKREEEMRRMGVDFQARLRTFGEEMASKHRRNFELEKRLAEADARASSAVEAYKGSARFLEERTEACADAFRLCEEDIRARISRAHPEWDLSFLDAEFSEACTPGVDEAEYEDASDVDLEAVLGSSSPAALGDDVGDVEEGLVPKVGEEGRTREAFPEGGDAERAPPGVVGTTAGTSDTSPEAASAPSS